MSKAAEIMLEPLKEDTWEVVHQTNMRNTKATNGRVKVALAKKLSDYLPDAFF